MTRFPLRYFRSSLQDLVRELPLRALIPLALAIFSLFAVLGRVTDVLAGGSQPPWVVVRNALFSGTIALGYAFGSMRRQWGVFTATVIVQFAWVALGRRGLLGHYDVLPPERVREQLTFDGLVILVVMAASYSCFLWFINRYGGATCESARRWNSHARYTRCSPAVAAHRRVRVSGFSAPSGEVGGDLVDVVTRDDTWFGYVADVSGPGILRRRHGMFKSAIRMRLLQGGAISSLLDDLNTVLFPLKSGATYVTAAGVRGSNGASGALESRSRATSHPSRPRKRGRRDHDAADSTACSRTPVHVFDARRERGDVLALSRRTDGGLRFARP